MRRVSLYFCAALILVTCLANPVTASDLAFDNMVQLLDYGSANESGSNYLSFNNTVTAYYVTPTLGDYNYVDILVYCAGAAPTSIKAGAHPNTLASLTFVNVGGHLYRAYGYVLTEPMSRVYVQFTSDGSRQSYYTISSFRAGYLGLDSSIIEGYCEINAYDYNKTIHYIPTDEVNYRTFTGTSDFNMSEYTLFLYVDEIWKKYDYIDFYMLTSVDSILSVSAGFGTTSIPFEISYISNDSMSNAQFIYNVRLDLRDFDRTINDMPMVTVTGNVILGELNTVSVMGITGYVANEVISPNISWLQRISASLSNFRTEVSSYFSNLTSVLQVHTNRLVENLWDILTFSNTTINTNFETLRSNLQTHIDRLVGNLWDINTDLTTRLGTHFTNLSSWLQTHTNRLVDNLWSYSEWVDIWIVEATDRLEAAIRGNTAPGEQFQDQVEDKDQQLEDMADIMASVTQPAIDSIDVSADTLVDHEILTVSMSGLTSIISPGSLFYTMIVMSIMMATASFVLFGKR